MSARDPARRRDRYRGALLGLATGDALGTTLEFCDPGTFAPIADMVGGGPFGLKPGQWTDDTSMALCLAESLIECGGFDPVDQLTRYCRWRGEGHLSSTGACFDIGNTVGAALARFEQTGAPNCGPTGPQTAGNGSIMRLAPVPLLYTPDPAAAVRMSGESSLTTHGTRECVDACRYFGGLIAGALGGAPKEELLSPRYAPGPGLWEAEPLAPGVDEIASGSFRRKEPPEIRGGGYVVASLEAALWAFSKAGDFREGALLAVNLGNDADTTGAVYGQIAGAYYGESGIPGEWLAELAMADLIREFADGLFEMAGGA
jgi:ADP-ribosylglycohydrolase